tara:strand:+ start:30 stop:434 length:405 start_codon:yes stop_codon:yes gene_type:complete
MGQSKGGEGVSEASERMKRVAELHKEDRTLELASALGMSLKEWMTAYSLKEKIITHSMWTNRRSPHALMIDCLHLVGRYTKNKAITQVSIMNKTKELWGVCTSPRPNAWQDNFQAEIEEVLDVLNKDNEGEMET